MNMDLFTRRQADRIERVLRDLARDVELIACVPLDVGPWAHPSTLLAAGRGAAGPETDEEREDEKEDVRVARLIYETAKAFGDPTDVDNNEALQQMEEFAEHEKEMLSAATVVGAVAPADLARHHALFRAVVDTLHDGGYMEALRRRQMEHNSGGGANGKHSARSAFEEGAGRVSDPLCMRRSDGTLCRFCDPSVNALLRVVQALVMLVTTRNKTTVNEDVRNYKILHDAVNKEKTTSADVKALKREYQETKESRRSEVFALDEEIRQLEEEIEYTRSVAEMELAAYTEVNEKLQDERRITNEEHLAHSKEAAKKLKTDFHNVSAKHQEEVNALRTQRSKKETAVSAAITEYDTQMTTLKAATEALNKETEEDTEQLVALEEELEVLQKEKACYEFEKHVEEMREQHYVQMDERRNECARVVQAYFRSHIARVNFAKSQSGKKKRQKKQ